MHRNLAGVRRRDIQRILRSPRLLAHQVRAWIYELRHPGDPWWAPSAIRLLERELKPSFTALEWGSGRSTRWVAARVAHLTSIEHIPAWHARVRSQLAHAGIDNVTLHLHPLPEGADAFGASFWEETAYTMAAGSFPDESLDFVVVDGACRMPCAWRALPKIAPGGLLLIDDTLHLGSVDAWKIPANWELLHGPGPGVWATTIWRKPVR